MAKVSNIYQRGGEVFDVARANRIIFSATGLRGEDSLNPEGAPVRFVLFQPRIKIRVGDLLKGRGSGENMVVTEVGYDIMDGRKTGLKAYYLLGSINKHPIGQAPACSPEGPIGAGDRGDSRQDRDKS